MVGIIFGSSMGNTEEAANLIAKILGEKGVSCEVLNVAKTAAGEISKFDTLVLGSSTWGDGDLQDDWESFDFDGADFSGKKVAVFGFGDSSGYSDTFCNAVGKIYEICKSKGAKMFGETSSEGYEFDESEAFKDGKFVGLLLDNDNQSELTESRVKSWIEANFLD